jgi:hypothetical protein
MLPRDARGAAPLADNGAIETLVPGHGAIARGAAWRRGLREDLAYLDQLEPRAPTCAREARSLDDTIAELERWNTAASRAAVPDASTSTASNVRIAYRRAPAARGGA